MGQRLAAQEGVTQGIGDNCWVFSLLTALCRTFLHRRTEEITTTTTLLRYGKNRITEELDLFDNISYIVLLLLKIIIMW